MNLLKVQRLSKLAVTCKKLMRGDMVGSDQTHMQMQRKKMQERRLQQHRLLQTGRQAGRKG